MASAIVMPKAGNSVEECLLSKWRIKVGDVIKEKDIICDVETDKSAIEVEATAGGTVLALFGNEQDLIPVLQTICIVGNPGEDFSALAPSGAAAPAAPAAEPAPAAAPAAPAAPVTAAPAAAAVPAAATDNAPMSPRAKKFVAEHPFVVPSIQGTGAGGRIMEADVEAAYHNSPKLSSAAAAMLAAGVAAPAAGTGPNGMILAGDMGKPAAAAAPAAPAAAPVAAAPAAGEDVITEKPFAQIRKIIAKRLLESLQTSAQYTLMSEADVSGLLALRAKIKAQGEKLGLANINIGDMVMFAVIKALQKHPELNGEFHDNVVKLHSAINMGFACDTARGLMVPVLHNSQTTVSNLGAFGITNFTPVFTVPQLAILGVGKTLLRPVRAANGDIVYKDYMQFSLTMNHMVIDGAPGARFLQTLKDIIENFELVCIAGC